MINVREISPELKTKARDELNEVESRIPDDIARIRDWIEKQSYLTARTDDQFLLSYLRGCKYSLEKTKAKIDSLYTIKTLSPELFLHKRIDEKTMRLAKLGPILTLKKPLGPAGPRIHFIRYGHIDLDEFSVMDLFRMHLRVFEIQLYEDDNVFIGGYQGVVDVAGLSLNKILQFDLVTIRKMTTFFDKAIPFRLRGLHVINFPKEAEFFFNAAMAIMPNKLKEKFVVHSSVESLCKHIPREYLPEEYGGDNGSLKDSIDYWEKRFLQYKNFFDEDLKYGVNEKLRPGERVSLETIFGLEGSFRKLDVD